MRHASIYKPENTPAPPLHMKRSINRFIRLLFWWLICKKNASSHSGFPGKIQMKINNIERSLSDVFVHCDILENFPVVAFMFNISGSRVSLKAYTKSCLKSVILPMMKSLFFPAISSIHHKLLPWSFPLGHELPLVLFLYSTDVVFRSCSTFLWYTNQS